MSFQSLVALFIITTLFIISIHIEEKLENWNNGKKKLIFQHKHTHTNLPECCNTEKSIVVVLESMGGTKG